VLLVLIVVFMIVVAQEKTTGEKAQAPQPSADQAATPEWTIVIQVACSAKDQPPALRINQQEVAWADLHERLQHIFIGRAERVAFVKGNNDIDFQCVAEVIDIARNSGVYKVGLLGKQE
jgi:biopolymer transport protein TolR